MDLPLSRVARERYEFKDPILPPATEPAADGDATRRLHRRMSERRPPGAPPPPGPRQLQAMAVIHEAMHRVAQRFGGAGDDRLFRRALEGVSRDVGSHALDEALTAYAGEFPPPPVYQAGVPAPEFVASASDDRPHRELMLEELLLLWLANRNPAFMRHGELFDDWPVARTSLYAEIVEGLRRHMSAANGGADRDLVATLLEPIQAAPDSLAGQLRYIREHWPEAVELVDRLAPAELLGELDQEAPDLAVPVAGAGGPGPPDAQALHGFAGLDAEPERYSDDTAWMPRLVLIAKSTYVWLDQLSRSYGRAIRTLDAIPDAELERLARQGFSGLWLIGVWERSPASQRIKQLRGNPEAVASAYSLMDYRISEDLGGEEAFSDLRDRAWAHGIRLAADMVPNHMGIDSRWVVEQPDRFISRPESPFPAYTFTGPNLSSDERVGIYLEDHYQDGSDAAVVFKRVDRWSGEERFVYHGNDGTGMPWNDTAQLDYLREDTREAVIQTILAVARRAPIIRFDAAMTLARRHVQRLWYPLPGSGESIPSRAESAMDGEGFARSMPEEFWREVVDRVAAEAPDTLLLAEAFWLMEGYFVRTLGMHRVYNSAFMHMLRDEDNAGYRLVLKNTMSFDPEILKRYVNFMSNPDERTAIDQFGDGDKYLGVATVMATLPGLPMFGHGQVEGFSERYGMEFRRARLEEQPDPALVERHEKHIFPLLHLRSLFAGARDFRLYDVKADDDGVIEDVYAYSNAEGDRRALVVYHNRFAETRGHIREAIGTTMPSGDGGRSAVEGSLAEALGLPTDDDAWVVLRDERSGQEWLRPCRDVHERGLDVELRAYECRVFLDPRVVRDRTAQEYRRLAGRLGGAPVPSVEVALRELLVEPAREAIVALFDAAALRRVAGAGLGPDEAAADAALSAEEGRAEALLARIGDAVGRREAGDDAVATLAARLRAIASLVRSGRRRGAGRGPAALARWLGPDRTRWCSLLGWAYGAAVARALDLDPETATITDGGWPAEWGVDAALGDACRGLGADEARSWRAVELSRALLALGDEGLPRGSAEDESSRPELMPAAWASRHPLRRATGWNRWQSESFVGRDAYLGFLDALLARELVRAAAGGSDAAELDGLVDATEDLRQAGELAGWRAGPASGPGVEPDEPESEAGTPDVPAPEPEAAWDEPDAEADRGDGLDVESDQPEPEPGTPDEPWAESGSGDPERDRSE